MWGIMADGGQKTYGDFWTLVISFLIGGNVSPTRIRPVIFLVLHFGTKISVIKITEFPFF